MNWGSDEFGLCLDTCGESKVQKFEQIRSLPEMAAQTNKEIGLEIGHVLFIDMVGYSKPLINCTAHSCVPSARSAPE